MARFAARPTGRPAARRDRMFPRVFPPGPMPEIHPFRGVRYDMARVGALSDVVAPPYDVIGPDLQRQLYDLSPYNVIRLEYNQEQPGDAPGNDRYSRASGFLRDWRRSGVLRDEAHP